MIEVAEVGKLMWHRRAAQFWRVREQRDDFEKKKRALHSLYLMKLFERRNQPQNRNGQFEPRIGPNLRHLQRQLCESPPCRSSISFFDLILNNAHALKREAPKVEDEKRTR